MNQKFWAKQAKLITDTSAILDTDDILNIKRVLLDVEDGEDLEDEEEGEVLFEDGHDHVLGGIGKLVQRGEEEVPVMTASIFFVFDNDWNDYLTDFGDKATYMAAFEQAIRAVWEAQTYQGKPVEVNLEHFEILTEDSDYQPSNRSHNVFLVGRGGSDPYAAPEEVQLKDGVSYVASHDFPKAAQGLIPSKFGSPKAWGYMYQLDPAEYAAHEFGHLFGLADRYHEGVKWTKSHLMINGRQKPIHELRNRASIPMYLPENIDPDYRPLHNLYSDGSREALSGIPVLTPMQMGIVFSSKTEQRYPSFLYLKLMDDTGHGNKSGTDGKYEGFTEVKAIYVKHNKDIQGAKINTGKGLNPNGKLYKTGENNFVFESYKYSYYLGNKLKTDVIGHYTYTRAKKSEKKGKRENDEFLGYIGDIPNNQVRFIEDVKRGFRRNHTTLIQRIKHIH